MMKTKIISVDLNNIDNEKIEIIISTLNNNGVIVYPTDTFYGLGVNCLSGKAVRDVYFLKKRDLSKPLSIIISGIDMLTRISTGLPPLFHAVSDRFWPGPLTLILNAGPLLPSEILGGMKTIAVRWPDHSWLQEVVRKAGFPITATSANLTGEQEICEPKVVHRVFMDKVDMIVDGGRTPGGKPSTILDLTEERPKILREGAVASSELSEFLS